MWCLDQHQAVKFVACKTFLRPKCGGVQYVEMWNNDFYWFLGFVSATLKMEGWDNMFVECCRHRHSITVTTDVHSVEAQIGCRLAGFNLCSFYHLGIKFASLSLNFRAQPAYLTNPSSAGLLFHFACCVSFHAFLLSSAYRTDSSVLALPLLREQKHLNAIYSELHENSVLWCETSSSGLISTSVFIVKKVLRKYHLHFRIIVS